MNQEQNLEAGWWDKISDTFTAVSEGFVGFLGRLFGSSNERMVRSLGYIRNKDGTHRVIEGSLLDLVNSLEEKMKALTDEELKGLTATFRERLLYFPNFDDSDDWRWRSETTLEAALAASWAIRVGYLYTRDNVPAPGFEKSDSSTSVSLVWKR